MLKWSWMFLSLLNQHGLFPRRHGASIHVFSFVLILQCTMGAFIVSLIFNHKDIKYPLTAAKKQLVSIKDWLTAIKVVKCGKNKILILQ